MAKIHAELWFSQDSDEQAKGLVQLRVGMQANSSVLPASVQITEIVESTALPTESCDVPVRLDVTDDFQQKFIRQSVNGWSHVWMRVKTLTPGFKIEGASKWMLRISH